MRWSYINIHGDDVVKLRRKNGASGKGVIYAVHEFGERDGNKRLKVGEQICVGDDKRTICEVLYIISGRAKDLIEVRLDNYVGYYSKEDNDTCIVNRGYHKLDNPNIVATVILLEEMGNDNS